MEINRLIDHTLLKADASVSAIEKLCAEAREYEFASVCVNPAFVPLSIFNVNPTLYKLLKEDEII